MAAATTTALMGDEEELNALRELRPVLRELPPQSLVFTLFQVDLLGSLRGGG